MTLDFEREYQNKLDRYSRVNENEADTDWFLCHYCEMEYPQEDQCDHLPSIHQYCYNCCHEFYDKPIESFNYKDDLD